MITTEGTTEWDYRINIFNVTKDTLIYLAYVDSLEVISLNLNKDDIIDIEISQSIHFSYYFKRCIIQNNDSILISLKSANFFPIETGSNLEYEIERKFRDDTHGSYKFTSRKINCIERGTDFINYDVEDSILYIEIQYYPVHLEDTTIYQETYSLTDSLVGNYIEVSFLQFGYSIKFYSDFRNNQIIPWDLDLDNNTIGIYYLINGERKNVVSFKDIDPSNPTSIKFIEDVGIYEYRDVWGGIGKVRTSIVLKKFNNESIDISDTLSSIY